MGRPFEHVDAVFVEPFRRVLRIVVLLEDEIGRHRQLISGLKEVTIEDVDVQRGVHPGVDEFHLALTRGRHTTPNHDVATAEFHRTAETAELERFSRLSPNMHWTVRRDEVRPKDLVPKLERLVAMLQGESEPSFLVLLGQVRFLAGDA